MKKNVVPVVESQRKKKERQLFRVFTAVVVLLCVLVGLVCFWFYDKLHSTIRDESNGYLQEIAVRIESNIDRIISDTYAMLYSTDMMIGERENATFADLAEISASQQRHWGFQRMLLIDEDGNARDAEGKTIFLSGGEYLQGAILQGVASMSPLQVVDGQECSIFAVPLNKRMVSGVEAVALAVTYDTTTFAEVLSMSSFSNQAYSNIVSRDGTVIISSNADARASFGYNLLSSIESTNSVSRDEMQTLRDNIHGGATGQVVFTYDGRQEYMVYRPISSTDWMLLTFVPMEVVNAKSNLLLSITLLISGFIVLSFTALVVLLLTAFRRYQRSLEKIAYVDNVTGGNTIDRFYELANSVVSTQGHPCYALVYTNFGKFKILNEKFGRPVCDEILRIFYQIIVGQLDESECMGRLTADNFCILLRCNDVEDVRRRLEAWYQLAMTYLDEHKPIWSFPPAEFGIYMIENDTMPFPHMIDRAKLALRETPRSINAKLCYAVYNDEVRSRLVREKQLEDMMESALSNHEFQMYLQPKYSTQTDRIAGAEALSRWMSESEGMIYPNEFIPLFEKNGFIVQLDLWIFEEVCKLLHKWIEEGRTPIKISVNCSRVHLRDSEFLRHYRILAHKYHVPTHLIEIELTESIVLEDGERFKRVVEEIHQAGFGCSMDDFGSGYSSLNMLQEISVDTLKLDKVFFHSATRDPVRTESVVSNIVGMTKALSMGSVAEGVEHPEQVEMLRRIGCELIQGYVFAKPMPVADFEKRWDSEEKGE